MQEAPAENAARAPVDLIAKHVRDRHPKQTGNDEQISEHGYEQPACLVTQKRRIEQRFSGQQAKNSKRAYCEKFFDETQGKHVTDRQRNQKRPPESGELTHWDRRDEPEAPDQIECQQNNSRNTRTRKALRDISEVRFHQTGHADQNEERTGDDARNMQRWMVNHIRHGESVLGPRKLSGLDAREIGRIGVPYKLKPLARSIWTSTSSPTSSSLSSPARRSLGGGGNTTILFVRVRPINRAGFVLLGPSQRISTVQPTNRSPARRADSFTIRSKS